MFRLPRPACLFVVVCCFFVLGLVVNAMQDVLVVLRDIQGSINSLGSGGGGAARLTNSSAGGSAGPRAIPARATPVGKIR